MRIFLIGFMGSGKSHWGKILRVQMKLPFFDLDKVICDKENATVPQIFAAKGEEYFRMKEREVLEALVDDHDDLIIACGGGTPCFFQNIDFMKSKGFVVWLDTPVNVLVTRLLKEKSNRPLIKNIGDAELENYIRKKLHERKIYYEQADLRVDEHEMTTERLTNLITNA
jgi:shikimate kinase